MKILDISNQMELTGEVLNFESDFLYNEALYNFFDTSPVSSIWLEISMNWHTKSQGPKKKCTHFTTLPVILSVQ